LAAVRLALAAAAALLLVAPTAAYASDSSAMPSALTSGVAATADTTGYSIEPNEPNTREPFTQQCGSPYNVGVARTAWYTVQGAGGQVTVTTSGSDFDTSLFVYTGSPGGGVVACNDDQSDSDTTSSVSFPSTAGTTYFIQVGRACNEVGPPKCADNPPSGTLSLTATALSTNTVGDADHDGYVSSALGGPDCDDGNPAIHPGVADVPHDGIDQDCSGKDAPYPRLRVTTAVSVGYARRFTVITQLKVTGAQRGSTIRLSCSSRRKGCRFTRRTITVRSAGTVRLGKYLKKAHYRKGARITLSVAKPGYIGTHIRYTVRLHRLPAKTTRCTQPGQSRPRTTCS
jgi:Putative metal-binding motif/Bacterial pre-peptidase C-terminal domain